MTVILSDEQTFIPPKEVALAAAKGLQLREKFQRGGTEIGWARAESLKNRDPITRSTIERISRYFARHAVDKNAKNFGNDDNPSRGYIAWLLWGGDQGRNWVESIKKTPS